MKTKIFILELALAVGLLSTQVASAGTTGTNDKPLTPANQTSVSPYSELDELRSRNAILTEQLKNAKLLNEMNATKGGPSEPVHVGLPARSKQTTSTSIDHSARVLLVAGVAGKLTATIQMSDGGNTLARLGMRIPNLGLVKSIRTDEVLVENGKEIFSVPFASEPAANATQYSPQQPVPPMPPLPQPMGAL